MAKLIVNIDNLTLGDLEKLDGDSFRLLMEVFDNCVVIEDVPPEGQKEELRKLNWKILREIGEKVRDAIADATNPTVDGKN